MSIFRPKLRQLALTTALTALAAHPGALQAQDTEIYLGSDALAPSAQPNVLFVLDTSFSMTTIDFGQTISRMEQLKQAGNVILDSVNNINAGIMRFTNPGGAVLFPVADIEASAASFDSAGQPDVTAFMQSSADDAEELGGVMCLNSPVLELTNTPASCTETTIGPVQVNTSTDDAEEALGGGVVTNSDNMEAVDTPGGGFGDRTNGLIFRSLGVPSGARITQAFVEFNSLGDREGPVTLNFFGERTATPATFSFINGPNGVGRVRTAATVSWTPPLLTPNDFHRTPDLSAIVQEVVNVGGWGAASSLSVIFNGTTAADDTQRRDFATIDTGPGATRAARLTVTYGTGPGGAQKLGLRFPNVNVPQGVRIQSAFIEFTTAAQGAGAEQVTISGEDVDDAAAFTTTANDISNRTKTTNNVSWNIPAWNNVRDVQRSPDLSAVVEEIVGRSNWCGGQDMAFIIESASGAAVRKALSFNGDPTLAPVLRIDYDENSPLGSTEGCVERQFQSQVSASLDDATEVVSTGATLPTLTAAFMGSGLVSGYRFQGLEIPAGSQIVSARLHMTGEINFSGAAAFGIRGQLTPDSSSFSSSANDITARPTTSALVNWSPVPNFLVNQEYPTPDLTAVIQEIVNQSAWAPGNDLVLVTTNGSGTRAVKSFDRDAARAPRLTVTARILLGATASAAVTVRQRLKDVVNELPTLGSTPLVDTFYEAALYFRGDPADYGRTRGNSASTFIRRQHRISHPGSYTGGTVNTANGATCPTDDLNAVGCAFQQITGSPVYKSPIAESCQGNYIVLLTDGIANINNSQAKIRTMTGDSSCSTTLLDGTTPLNDVGEQCGIELAAFLATADQNDDVEEVNVVNTFTIGFNLTVDTDGDGAPDAPSPAVPWLEDVAAAGQGDFYPANSAEQLAAVFRDILAEILSRTTSFATPSLSVNAFNRLFHRNEVYFSLFVPTDLARWDGNVKKYQICRSELDGCEVGEVLDFREPPPGDLTDAGQRDGEPAIDPSSLRIVDSARSDWLPSGAEPDGSQVLVGGAGRVLQAQGHSSRRVFTFAGGSLPTTLSTGSIHEIVDSNTAIDIALLGGSTDPADPTFMTATERNALIQWIRGVDVDDEDNDNSTTDTRYLMGDPLHSSPVAITFGGTEAEPVIFVFVGTNDGVVRMLNAYTGEEEWAFIPPALLPTQRVLRDNPRQDHVYGVDGTPTLWINDEDNDGVINPAVDVNGDGQGEFVRMFIGLRRGGSRLLAFDVTPDGLLTDPVNDTITPELLWVIAGNNSGATLTPLEYARLGETWSRPRITTIRSGEGTSGSFTSQARPALIFAGGYDSGAQDGVGGLAAAGVGNAIYVVDPTDGSRIAYVTATSNLAQHTGGAGVGVAEIIYPIPSDVALLDTDGDGATNRLYVADTGGQVWRVDLVADTNNGGLDLIVGRLATVSTLGSKKNARKFFYPPDVVQVRGRTSLSVVGDYDLVTIASGNRAHPLDLDVQNRFYAIHDETVGTLADGNGSGTADGIADNYPFARDGSGGAAVAGFPILGPVDADGTTVAAGGDLLDVTDVIDFDPATSEGAANLAELKSRSGYYLDLGPPAVPGVDPPFNAGEKGLSSPIILAGKVFFTTYLPRGVVPSSGCALSEGSGLLYGLDVLTGAPAYNYDQSGDDGPLTISDRTYQLGGGIPSAAVPIFQPEAITLLIGGGGGASTVNPNITLPRDRTYWVEE